MTIKRGRKPKYIHTLVLEGVNARDIYKKYKNHTIENTQNFTPIIEYTNRGEESSTNILDLSVKSRPTELYYDINGCNNSITMIDYVNYGCLPERTDIRCYHCHHSFNTSPIGVPIEYIQKKWEDLNKEEVCGINDYYHTFGVFCSFPCCLAYIRENKHKSLFVDSLQLLYSLYYKIYGCELKIKPAPNAEVLKVYGGDLSIDEYRRSFCSTNYVITQNIKRPYMVAVGKYVKQKKYGYI